MTASHTAPSASQIELLAERTGPDRARRTAPDSPVAGTRSTAL